MEENNKPATPSAFAQKYAVWIVLGALTAFVLWNEFQPTKARARPKFD